MKAATMTPFYVGGLYPGLTEIARQHGYALAVHGSCARDFDLVCIPWVQSASDPQTVVDAIVGAYAIKQQGEPEQKLHGRLCYTLIVSFGECFLDLSFMPLIKAGGGEGMAKTGEPLSRESGEQLKQLAADLTGNLGQEIISEVDAK